MNTNQQMAPVEMEKGVRNLRLILGALVIGLLLMTVAALFVNITEEGKGEDLQILVWVCFLLAVAEIPCWLFLRAKLLGQVRARLQAQEGEGKADLLPPELFALTMIGAALAEGVGLFGTVVFFLTRQHVVLVLPGLAILAILLLMPSKERFEELLENLRRDARAGL